jgi:hypothetical protein
VIKKLLYLLLAAFVVIQFFRPAKNTNGDDTNSIHKNYALPQPVATILNKACNDCHTNKTNYPWYSQVQPVLWWLQGHVNDGKKHLNFSTLASKPLWLQFHKMEEVQEQIEKNEMPLSSYTWLHGDAKLTENEKAQLIAWSKTVRDSMQARYPTDSLKRPARK